MYMKYIVADRFGMETPFLFPSHLQHNEVAKALGIEVISAGIVTFTSKGLKCRGESITLGVYSRPEEDSELINRELGL